MLHSIDLTIERGEHVVILGPNGCGKSSLLKLFTCEQHPLVRPGSQLRIFGRERWLVTELRSRLGIVETNLPGASILRTPGLDAVLTGFFSAATLWPHLTVTAAMRASALERLEQMGAAHLAAKPVGQMSAGEARRVMIARALVQGPEMLLMDEPSNALDIPAQRELREALRRLCRQGTGLVLVTHHLPDILPEIDRVIMMREGRIFRDGSKRDLLTEAQLSELFGEPVELAMRGEYFHALG